MSDKHTGYRSDSYHAASDEGYQNQHAIDPRTGQPVQNWQQEHHAQADQGYYHAQGYGHAEQGGETSAYQQYYQQQKEAAAQQQAYGHEADAAAAYGQADQYSQHYGHGNPAYGQHAGYGQEEAYSTGQHAAYQGQDAESYYAQAHAQTGGHAYDHGQYAAAGQHYQHETGAHEQDYHAHAQVDTGQAPALYGAQDQMAYANAGGHDAYAMAQNGYGYAEGQGYDYAAHYAAQGGHPQGMPQLNDPYAPTPLHVAQSENYKADEISRSAGRKSFLVGAMILGSVIVGGGVATAYKYSGDGANGGRAPIILSEGGENKVPPADPGGKDFGNLSKKIYDRLGDGGEVSKAGIITTSDPDVTNKLRGGAEQDAKLAAKTKADAGEDGVGGPRLVKTVKFNRNGEPIVDDTVVVTRAPDVKDMSGVAVDTGKPPVAVKTLRAGAVRTQDDAEQQVARLEANRTATDGNYVVQISARRSQQDALSAFSGLQNKYGTVLAGYRPLIQRADLGTKGVFYRLRVGPMKDKESASSVCSKLKSQGLPSCFVTER